MYWNSLTSTEFLVDYWADAATINATLLDSLFEAANEVCVAYAPALLDGQIVPERYKIAEILQARHIYSQMQGGNREEIGADGYATPSYPLVFAARDLLRPKRSPLSRLGL